MTWSNRFIAYLSNSGLVKFTAGEITRTLVVRNENPFLHREPATKLEKEFDALPAGVDGVVFRSVPVEDRLETLTFGAGRVRYVPRQYERYFVNLDTSHEDYVQSFFTKNPIESQAEGAQVSGSRGW